MALISGSNQVLQKDEVGTYFTSNGSSFVLDVDTRCRVRMETRRDVNDAQAKPLSDGMQEGATQVIVGPASVTVQSVTGRQYRVICLEGRAQVSADQ